MAFTPLITDIKTTGEWFKGGVNISKAAPNTPSTQVITEAPLCTLDIDFPALGAASDYGGCIDSPAFACPGVAHGDPCMVGMKEPTVLDGGSLTANITFEAMTMAAGFVKVRACMIPGDGGSANAPDAGFVVRCFSNQ
jgi:hypothetical protein